MMEVLVIKDIYVRFQNSACLLSFEDQLEIAIWLLRRKNFNSGVTGENARVSENFWNKVLEFDSLHFAISRLVEFEIVINVLNSRLYSDFNSAYREFIIVN